MSTVINASGIVFPDATVQTTASVGGGIASVTATSPLASSGGANPAISLSGIVPAANGGTGAASLTGVLYFNGASAATAATGSQIATLLGTTAVAQATSLVGGGANQIAYQTAANTTSFLPAGTAGLVLTSNGSGSAPTWNGVIGGLF